MALSSLTPDSHKRDGDPVVKMHIFDACTQWEGRGDSNGEEERETERKRWEKGRRGEGMREGEGEM